MNDSLAERLWYSDEASALTNEAAREIERLRKNLERRDNFIVSLGLWDEFLLETKRYD